MKRNRSLYPESTIESPERVRQEAKEIV